MNKSIYIIILFYFVPFLVKGYSLPPLKNYGTCKDVYNDSITNEYTIISKKDASVVWYRAVNASDTIVVLSLKSKPQLEVGEQYRLTLGKISRLKILKGRYSALIFDKDTVFLGITFSREDCELQIKTYHLLLEVESIKASSSTSKKDISIHNHHGIMAIDINREMMTRDWCGGHLYRNGALERIENEYGYWADSCYHYRITDYQGNVQAVISQNGVLEEVNGYYPYGGLLGLPQLALSARIFLDGLHPCLLSVAPMGLNIMIHAYITGVAPAAPPPAYYLAPLTGLAAGVSDGMDDTDFPKHL